MKYRGSDGCGGCGTHIWKGSIHKGMRVNIVWINTHTHRNGIFMYLKTGNWVCFEEIYYSA